MDKGTCLFASNIREDADEKNILIYHRLHNARPSHRGGNPTPTYGFWLNLVEGFLSKLTKQMLQGIRVASVS